MTAIEFVWAVESCAMSEAEALERTGAETMVALYRQAILELAPQLRQSPATADNASRRQARAA